MYKKAEKGFKAVMRIPVHEWCAETKKNGNSALKQLYRFFKSLSNATSSKSCPYEGRLEMVNVSLNHQLTMFLPNGVIRFTYHWWSDNKELLLWASVLFKIEN
jgi:hypothetical protein